MSIRCWQQGKGTMMFERRGTVKSRLIADHLGLHQGVYIYIDLYPGSLKLRRRKERRIGTRMMQRADEMCCVAARKMNVVGLVVLRTRAGAWGVKEVEGAVGKEVACLPEII